MIDSVATMVSSVGFPVVCCIILWKYINTTLKGFIKTIEENTKVLTKLCEKLEGDEHK